MDPVLTQNGTKRTKRVSLLVPVSPGENAAFAQQWERPNEAKLRPVEADKNLPPRRFHSSALYSLDGHRGKIGHILAPSEVLAPSEGIGCVIPA